MGKSRLTLIRVVSLVGLLFLFVFLQRVFNGEIILKQAFSVGSVSIHYYGIILAIAAFAGILYAKKRAPQYGLLPETVESVSLWIVFTAFFSARVYHVITDYWRYEGHFLDALKIWNGGLSIYGALFGGLLAIFLLKIFNSELKKIPFLVLLDFITPAFLLGQIIGRFGNFVNYEAFGFPTLLPWKMFVPLKFRPEIYLEQSFFHPTFLYESLGNVLIFCFLYWFTKSSGIFSKFKANGSLFFMYLILYNCLRLFTESLRIDSVVVGNVHVNAVMSSLLVIIGVFGLIYGKRVTIKTHTN